MSNTGPRVSLHAKVPQVIVLNVSIFIVGFVAATIWRFWLSGFPVDQNGDQSSRAFTMAAIVIFVGSGFMILLSRRERLSYDQQSVFFEKRSWWPFGRSRLTTVDFSQIAAFQPLMARDFTSRVEAIDLRLKTGGAVRLYRPHHREEELRALLVQAERRSHVPLRPELTDFMNEVPGT